MKDILHTLTRWIHTVPQAIGVAFRSLKEFLSKLWSHRHIIKTEMLHKQRLVVMDTETYREKWSLQLSFINVFVWGGVSIILLIIVTTILIAFTPLRELIPGYTDSQMVEQTYQNAMVIDSLEAQLEAQEALLANIKDVIMGVDPEARIRQADSARAQGAQKDNPDKKAATYSHSAADSVLRHEVESQDRYSVNKRSNLHQGSNASADQVPAATTAPVLLFTPAKGKIITSYDVRQKHFGVDIAGGLNEAVKAVAPGTVVMASFTADMGHVIAIQHQGGMISVYKNTCSLLKREGDVVRVGEPIGYLGQSGSGTLGPHLHFELWVGGNPVNPVSYISF